MIHCWKANWSLCSIQFHNFFYSLTIFFFFLFLHYLLREISLHHFRTSAARNPAVGHSLSHTRYLATLGLSHHIQGIGTSTTHPNSSRLIVFFYSVFVPQQKNRSFTPHADICCVVVFFLHNWARRSVIFTNREKSSISGKAQKL